LLFLLAAEGAVYLAAREAAGYWQRAAEREFTAVACCRQEVDKVPYAALINRWAGAENLNARLVASVIRAESSFQPRAVSHAGARGLMQVAPGTWRMVNARTKACSRRHAGECGEECWFDPELNIRIGTAYLGELVRQYRGDLVLALAAYNAGPAAVDRYGGVPPYPETQGYVAKVIAYWYDISHLPPPAPSLAAGRAETAVRLAGWALTATGVFALGAAGRLFRRRFWRRH